MNLKLSNIEFSYDKDQAPIIKNFSLEINEGDIIGIKGASGSGKTTLFRLILGFETPDKGSILFNDKLLDPQQLQLLRKETTWLPQDLNLGEGKLKDVFYYPFSFENNKSKKPDKNTVLSTFKALGLDETIWESNFRDLSTGQRQRVGIALSHLLNKSVMILDEPTSALDEASKHKVESLLFDGKRMIISTSHDPWWLEKCTQIVELNL